MDGPHVCQHCSTTFMLASSLRTHAVHIHEEGLQAYLAESGYHPSGGFGNHGDTMGDVKPDKIKRETMCGTDCEADIVKPYAVLMTDSKALIVNVGVSGGHCSGGHCKPADDSHSGNHGDTTDDIKPDTIKAEKCDCEVDSVQYNTLVIDRQAKVVSDVHGKIVNNSSYTHADTVGHSDAPIKSEMMKVCDRAVKSEIVKVCGCEVDCLHCKTLVTDKEPHVSDIRDKILAENNQLNLRSPKCVVPEKGALPQIGAEIGTCKASERHIYKCPKSNDPEHIHSGDNAYACKVYKKTFTSISKLKRQERIHIRDKPYTCNVCKQSFTQPGHLRRHEHIRHTGNKLACNVCKKIFAYISSLKRHERIHTGEKPYACNVCGKKFACTSNLKSHERNRHIGDKPYICNVCKRSFIYKSNMKRHELIHTGDKPFACNVCGKRFTGISVLNRHERIHTDDKRYACNSCSKTFNRLDHLRVHERIHTGDKPYTCNVCKKSFPYIFSLKRHGRIHTGDKPYACNVCRKSFSQNSSLKKHERIHTGENVMHVTSAVRL